MELTYFLSGAVFREHCKQNINKHACGVCVCVCVCVCVHACVRKKGHTNPLEFTNHRDRTLQWAYCESVCVCVCVCVCMHACVCLCAKGEMQISARVYKSLGQDSVMGTL